jgi:hypothetical protein
MATPKDIIYLFGILITCVFLDCALFRFDDQMSLAVENHNLYHWVHAIIFQLRIYLPLFALIIQIRITKTNFDFQKISYLLVALWLCNEVAFEFTLAIRSYIFQLLLFPVKDITTYYVVESVLGVGLITLLFPGFYCAMTTPFTIGESVNEDNQG